MCYCTFKSNCKVLTKDKKVSLESYTCCFSCKNYSKCSDACHDFDKNKNCNLLTDEQTLNTILNKPAFIFNTKTEELKPESELKKLAETLNTNYNKIYYLNKVKGLSKEEIIKKLTEPTVETFSVNLW